MSDEDDWFNNMKFDDSWTLQWEHDITEVERDNEKLPVEESNNHQEETHEERTGFVETCPGRIIIHKRGLPLDLSLVFQTMNIILEDTCFKKLEQFSKYMVMFTYGKRNIRKDAVDVEKLTPAQREVYLHIRRELDQNDVRKKRVYSFINQKDITKRLINYFAVHYSLVENAIWYYLDRRTYPYKILGKLGDPNQPEILRLIEQGANIKWLNFHQEYKNSKNRQGNRSRHAPYRRSETVYGEDGEEYSLTELNFYLWLDDVGGFELFYKLEKDIRKRKAKYDEEKRLQEAKPVFGKRKKKQKIMLRDTDGQNYKAFMVQYKKKPPFSVMHSNCSFKSFVKNFHQREALKKRQRDQDEDLQWMQQHHTTDKVLQPPHKLSRTELAATLTTYHPSSYP